MTATVSPYVFDNTLPVGDGDDVDDNASIISNILGITDLGIDDDDDDFDVIRLNGTKKGAAFNRMKILLNLHVGLYL